MRTIWTLVLALILGGAATAHAAPRYGVVDIAAGPEACLIMSGPMLAPGTRLLVVVDNPQTAFEATVGAVRDSACAANAMVAGTSYAIDLGDSLTTGPDLGIAVLAPESRIVRQGKHTLVRTPGYRTPLRIATCAAGEGIHLTAWRGSKRVWHEYFYLGYDLEPDCTEAEVE
jgi:hypothetical protein